MKLFVWHGVLTDYSSGMIVIMARTEKAAREHWRKCAPYQSRQGELDDKEPKVYPCNKQMCAFVYGGG